MTPRVQIHAYYSPALPPHLSATSQSRVKVLGGPLIWNLSCYHFCSIHCRVLRKCASRYLRWVQKMSTGGHSQSCNREESYDWIMYIVLSGLGACSNILEVDILAVANAASSHHSLDSLSNFHAIGQSMALTFFYALYQPRTTESSTGPQNMDEEQDAAGMSNR